MHPPLNPPYKIGGEASLRAGGAFSYNEKLPVSKLKSISISLAFDQTGKTHEGQGQQTGGDQGDGGATEALGHRA